MRWNYRDYRGYIASFAATARTERAKTRRGAMGRWPSAKAPKINLILRLLEALVDQSSPKP